MYKQQICQSPADGLEILDGENYPGFPIVPLWGNPLRQSELVGMRSCIDAYDLIESGFANNLDDTSMIYWVLENSGGIGGYTHGKEGRVRISNPNVPYIAMHTHPSGLEFASIDIQKFAMHPNMVKLTAVGNNGRVFALERKSDCDNAMISFLVQQLAEKEQNAIQKTEVVQYLRIFYKEAKRYGIEYYS